MKKYLLGLISAVVLLASLPSATQAYSYYGSSNDISSVSALQARLQSLIQQVQQLQAELARMRPTPSTPTRPGQNYCDTCYGTSRLDTIEVDFEHNYARVRIEYTNGRSVSRIYAADTENEVVDFIMSETGHTRNQIIAVTDFKGRSNHNSSSDEDVDRIRVRISSGDAHVTVYYEDDSTDTFTVDNETNHDDIISEVADELDMDESDVEDVISFTNGGGSSSDEVDRIRVRIASGDAHVTVYYEDGDTDTFTLDNETNHDDIISEVADELDMDESDVEDVINFTGDTSTSDDVDTITVTIYDNGRDSRARVRYDNGDSDTFYYDTDDEDDIISELADELDMDDDDVEDVVDFNYSN